MNKKEFNKNVKMLEKNGIIVSKGEDFSVELECYTNGGGDIIINLDEPSKEKLQECIDGFDINMEVILWWPNGQKGNGVPFDNIRDHYNDYEEWLNKMQEICNRLQY
jgi:hypothetical protein